MMIRASALPAEHQLPERFRSGIGSMDQCLKLVGSRRARSNVARTQMHDAHAAAAYDKWFAAEINAALAEADAPAVRHVSHADAMALLDAALTRATRSAQSTSSPERFEWMVRQHWNHSPTGKCALP